MDRHIHVILFFMFQWLSVIILLTAHGSCLFNWYQTIYFLFVCLILASWRKDIWRIFLLKSRTINIFLLYMKWIVLKTFSCVSTMKVNVYNICWQYGKRSFVCINFNSVIYFIISKWIIRCVRIVTLQVTVNQYVKLDSRILN